MSKEILELLGVLESEETRVAVCRQLQNQLGKHFGLKCPGKSGIVSGAVFHHYLDPLVASSDHHLSKELVTSTGQLNHLIALVSDT